MGPRLLFVRFILVAHFSIKTVSLRFFSCKYPDRSGTCYNSHITTTQQQSPSPTQQMSPSITHSGVTPSRQGLNGWPRKHSIPKPKHAYSHTNRAVTWATVNPSNAQCSVSLDLAVVQTRCCCVLSKTL